MLAVTCFRPKPNRFTLSTDPNTRDACGTRICPRILTGAMVLPSTRSPAWEMREPVGVDTRTSRVVPAGISCAQSEKETRADIDHPTRRYCLQAPVQNGAQLSRVSFTVTPRG